MRRMRRLERHANFELANQMNEKYMEYMQKGFNADQMKEIKTGLEKGLDVSIYAKPEFNHEQMEQIRLGLEWGLDASRYAKPENDVMDMELARTILYDESCWYGI